MSETGVITTTEGVTLSEGKATTSTFSLSAAFKSLAASLGITTTALGVITGALAAVAVGAIAYKKWADYQEELRQSAYDTASALDEQNKSVDGYVERYKELRTALQNAKGDEEATYAIKQDLLTLQNELNDAFGEEYGRLNLVTDAYRDQTEAIKAYNKEIAQNFLNENDKAIKTATSKMKEDVHYNLSYGNDGLYSDEGKVLKEIAESYKDRGISVIEDESSATFSIQLNASAEDAESTITDFMNDVREKAKELGDEELFSDVLEISSSSLKQSQDIISKYGEIYKESLLSEIAIDPNLANGYNQITQAVEDYNEAILSSEDPYSDANVKSAWDNLQTLKQGIQDNSEEWGKYEAVTTEAFEQANDSMYSFYQALQTDDELIKLSNDLKGLEAVEVSSMVDDGVEDSFDTLCKKADEYGLGVQDVISLLQKLGVVQGEIADTADDYGNEIDVSFQDSLKNIFGEDSSLSDFTGQMENLGSYLTKLKNNTITTEDIIALQDMGIVGDSIEDIRKQLEDLMNTNLDGIIDKIDELIASSANEETKQKLQTLKETLESYNHEVQNTEPPSYLSFSMDGNSTAEIEKLKDGFDQIDKIYADVYDKESFDWSSIFNNDEFFNTFGKFEDEYNSFINTISNSPSDLNACQSAFDNLVTAYVNGSGALDKVTEATKASTIADLERMGVTNASAVVEAHLTANEEARELETRAVAAATSDMSGATQTATQDLLAESDMSDFARVKLFQLVAQQTIFNNQSLDVSDKINQLGALASAYGLVAQAAAGAMTDSRMDANAKARASEEGITYEQAKKEYLDYQYKQLIEQSKEQYDVPQVNYGGGSATQSAKDAANSAKDAAQETKEQFYTVFDWMEKKINYLERIATKAIERVTNSLQYAMDKNFVSGTLKKLNEQMSTNAYMVKRYESSANAVGLNSDLKKKIKNGGNIDYYKDHNIHDDYGHVYSEELNKQIEAYSDWIEKSIQAEEANEQLKDSVKELAEAIANAPIDKAAEKIEKLDSATELLEAKIENKTTANGKNTLIDKESSNIDKTLSNYKTAYTQTKTNLNSYKNKVTGQKVAKGATKKEKTKYKNLMAKVKSFAKSCKPITDKVLESIYSYCSSVQDFSWYQNAVAYNEALNAKFAAEETYNLYKQTYETEKRELAKQKFDNVADEYNNKISLKDNEISKVDAQLSQLEAKGVMADASYYESQKSSTSDKLAYYKEEKVRLEALLPTLEKNTQEWYDAKSTIAECDENIIQCTTDVYEFNNAIRELEIEKFQKISDIIGDIVEEQELLAKLMSHADIYDDNGSFTDEGLATLGTDANAYYAHSAEADRYKKEIEELENRLATGNLGNYNSTDQIEDRIKELYDSWRGEISSTYDAQVAIFDMMEQKFDAESDALQELVDARKEALNLQKEIFEYQNTIAEKTKSITNLQKQISAYQGDTSQEGQSRLQKLQVELEDAQKDLSDTEYDKYISDQQDMLDKLLEEFEEGIEKQLKDFEDTVAKGLATANENTSKILTTLQDVASKNNYTVQYDAPTATSLQGYVTQIITAIEGKEVKDNAGYTSTGELKTGLQQPTVKNISSGNDTDKKYQQLTEQRYNLISTRDRQISSLQEQMTLARLNNKTNELSQLGNKISEITETYNKQIANIDKEIASLGIQGFSKGGVVSVDDIEKQVKANGDSVLASVNKGERILTPVQNDLFEKFINNGIPELTTTANMLQPLVNISKLPEIAQNQMNSNIGDVQFTFDVSCDNAVDLVKQIQSDRKIQQAIQAVTIDQISGKARLSVNKIK